ncbi:MAG: hypothetical protein J5806_07725 [Lentisphaeria bacterium]|nr:hypothetical protein [Lentisphaeria bacterium]
MIICPGVYDEDAPYQADLDLVLESFFAGMERFYLNQRGLRRNEPLAVRRDRIASCLTIELFRRDLSGLYAADLIQVGKRPGIGIAGWREPEKKLLAVDFSAAGTVSPALRGQCTGLPGGYKLGFAVRLNRGSYRLNWHVPEPVRRLRLTHMLMTRMDQAYFLEPAGRVPYSVSPRRIAW